MSPIDRSKYPKDWEAISKRVREQAGNRCQFCGVANGTRGYRDKDGVLQVSAGYCHGTKTCIRIVLTVAHLDHDTTNNADSNLRALCQRCHLRYDAKHHAANAARTRAAKKIAAGQLEMI